MNENQRTASVLPLQLPPGVLRRRAEQYMAEKRSMDALPLLRRAEAAQPDPAVRLLLATALQDLGCYEQAADLLLHTLASPDAPQACWQVLAQCQDALGQAAAAQNSRYHEQYGMTVDDAPDHLLDPPLRPRQGAMNAAHPRLFALGGGIDQAVYHDAARAERLHRRAIHAWEQGRRGLAMRRFHRALRLTDDPAAVRVSMGLLLMQDERFALALHHFKKALALEPDDLRAVSGMVFSLHGLNRRQEAAALLRQYMPRFAAPSQENSFISAALWLRDVTLAEEYLRDRLRALPYRTPLLHLSAHLHAMQNEPDAARLLWQRALAVDPGDQLARLQLEHQEQGLPPIAPTLLGHAVPSLKQRVMQAAQQTWAEAGQRRAEPLLTPGSHTRQQLDWCFSQPLPQLHDALLTELLLTGPCGDALRSYLRELLMLPLLTASAKTRILVYMNQHGDEGPALIRSGARVGVTRTTRDPMGRKLWPIFLGCFLLETRRYGQSLPMACCAADWWACLNKDQRFHAAYLHRYDYVKAMEIFYLRCTGQHEAEVQVIRRLRTSRRRISRILRLFDPNTAPLKGVHRHEMH